MEREFNIKEEKWRVRDNDRQRQYINKHFAANEKVVINPSAAG
jgi:hypothetical protein